MPHYPTLYQINTRVHLNGLARALGRPATLDDLSDKMLDRYAQQGFEWLYLLGVWPTGPRVRELALQHPNLLAEYRHLLPDWSEADVCGSCFAIAGYHIADALGGGGAMLRLRERLHARGMRLMLDFIPNHVGLDHRWVWQHPEYFVAGDEEKLRRAPQNYIRIANHGGGDLILAHGRDPYFDGWSDTLQLNYANPDLQAAMTDELLHISGLCDGLRCDMAMLVRPEVFQRTWGFVAMPFWPGAIQAVRQVHPEFTFMAEVYWNQELALVAQGFDFCYDKGYYDVLLSGDALAVDDYMLERSDYHVNLARFLENHDERRAAAVFQRDGRSGNAQHKTAAILTYTLPGLRFFHEGQLDGWREKLPMQLCRGPQEMVDLDLQAFYSRLLAVLADSRLRDGYWQYHLTGTLDARPGASVSAIAWSWSPAPGTYHHSDERLLCVVNYAPQAGRYFVQLDWDDLRGSSWRFSDRLSEYIFEQDGDRIAGEGLQLDLAAWGGYIFAITQLS